MGDKGIVGASLAETVSRCLLAGRLKDAQRLKSMFKLSDKRFWYLRVDALSSNRDWAGMRNLANERKSPIGYRPFAEASIKAGQERRRCIFHRQSVRLKRPVRTVC